MMQFNQIKIKNNFEKQKEQFQKDNGKTWNENLNTYISYVNMKTNDMNVQITHQFLDDFRMSVGILFDKIDALNKEILKLKA